MSSVPREASPSGPSPRRASRSSAHVAAHTTARAAISTSSSHVIDLTTPPSSPDAAQTETEEAGERSQRPVRTYGSGRKGVSGTGRESMLFTPIQGRVGRGRDKPLRSTASRASSPALGGSGGRGGRKFSTDITRTDPSPATRKRRRSIFDPSSPSSSAHAAAAAAAAHALDVAHTPSSTMPFPPHVRTQPDRNSSATKRVLPNRIRRAAGGGAEGIRDLEEMVVDWLARYGAPSDEPPDGLLIYVTSLPLDYVDPPVDPKREPVSAKTEEVTLTPGRSRLNGSRDVSPRQTQARLPGLLQAQVQVQGTERIETPSWRMVKPGEDDQWEARGEMEALAAQRQAGLQSPVKRLRKALPDDPIEDMSDAHYIHLHKRYEALERRQRIREKEKLQFERYKLKSRIELLRNMGSHAWVSVVTTVLSRHPDSPEAGSWQIGKDRVRQEGGVEWLRKVLIKEGLDVLQRYDQLLPNEKRPKPVNGDFSRNSTPMSRAESPAEDEEMVEPEEETRAVDRRLAALQGRQTQSARGRRARRASSPAATGRRRKSHSMLSSARQVQSVPRPLHRRVSVGSPTQVKQRRASRLEDAAQDELKHRPGRPRKDTSSSSPPQPKQTPASRRQSRAAKRASESGGAGASPRIAVKGATPRTSRRSLSNKEHVSLPAPTRRSRGSLKKADILPDLSGGIWAEGRGSLGLSSLSSSGNTLIGSDAKSPKKLQEVSSDDVREMREVEAAVVL